MKFIELTRGHVAVVDDEDFEKVSAFKWHYAKRRKTASTGYAMTNWRHEDGRVHPIGMHRFLVGLDVVEQIDHKDGDGLNNRRDNLRAATHSQNQMNQKLPVDNTSGFKGVVFYKRTGRWMAQINAGGRHIHLGYFDSPIAAAIAYDTAAVQYHGEFARLNFPIGGAYEGREEG